MVLGEGCKIPQKGKKFFSQNCLLNISNPLTGLGQAAGSEVPRKIRKRITGQLALGRYAE